MAMQVKTVIKKDGTSVTEVLNRNEHLCSEVYKVTNRVGKQLSDEELPDCTTVHETTNE